MSRNRPLPQTEENTTTPNQAAKKSSAKSERSWPAFSFAKSRNLKVLSGLFLLFVSIWTLFAISGHLIYGNEDQSLVDDFLLNRVREDAGEVGNYGGNLGALFGYYWVQLGLGVGSYFLSSYLFVQGLVLLVGAPKTGNWSDVSKRLGFLDNPTSLLFETGIWAFFWSFVSGYLVFLTNTETYLGRFAGAVGYEISWFFHDVIGVGTLFLQVVIVAGYGAWRFGWLQNTGENLEKKFGKSTSTGVPYFEVNQEISNADPLPVTEEEATEGFEHLDYTEQLLEDEHQDIPAVMGEEDETPQDSSAQPAILTALPFTVVRPTDEQEFVPESVDVGLLPDVVMERVETVEEAEATEVFTTYDPTAELSQFKNPHLELLKIYPNSGSQVSDQELQENQQKIIDTLAEFNIGIASIRATVGPTVTLYEIVPASGVRIAKIKGLENDIALKLAALGIRIIAPIPGAGTVGIEVPNKTREVVSMRSVVGTEKFMRSEAELPIILGKSITNELVMADLATMPHLLVAGATGQGKSVCLNVILTSILYKKHPSQVKFVLVDPKKVELSIYHTLERHYLAKLPNAEEAIITDTKKVIYTLNSLCTLMDERYSLLKNASCRNILEYNDKFVNRKLSPVDGHYYMPYIVIVIDELADLMITAGKEVEPSIARLAQLARAIGIHMILATQRPSVNVITGTIKNNFPARISFKVTQAMDSRTILDTVGADQLIGRGDMLYSAQSNIIRLQCPFLDTPEVEAVGNFIGNQRGYADAYLLPEVEDPEEVGKDLEYDVNELDKKFVEAAKLIVRTQQGSTTLLQRKLGLGFARAGRVMDQLEFHGIVGRQEGSKPREVFVREEYQLDEMLRNIGLM